VQRAAICFCLALIGGFLTQTANAQLKKPNILVILGDDIGQSNISRYSHGLMGMMTPNIDSIGEHGMTFTDYYAENSCTAGRATFITGQVAVRTGMTKVGVPGAPVGIQKRDITIAEAIKPLGYATGQSARTIWGIVMSISRRITASMSSSATCIT
jgi:arylsulfatase